MMANFKDIYRKKRVLVTGHTGFKGSWLAIWLNELGAEVMGYAREPKSAKGNYVVSRLNEKVSGVIGDINDFNSLEIVFKQFQPEIVFHLAAQPLVRQSYLDPLDTLRTNLMGTANILEAVRLSSSVEVAVMITSDKCYENKERHEGYIETDRLGGYDPYSASKSGAELIISSYINSFFNPYNFEAHGKSVASVRAGNVIGGGDWSADRIIPDCITHLENDEPIKVRNPDSVRPWQHVLEPLGGYLLLGQKMIETPGQFCEPWNFGPDKDSLITVAELVGRLIEEYGRGSWESVSNQSEIHETGYLALDCSKAKNKLNWRPLLSVGETIKLTTDWYKKYDVDKDCYSIAADQINYYSARVSQMSGELV